MKIVICTDAYLHQSTTAASHANILQKGFAALGHHVHVLTSDPDSDSFYEERNITFFPARTSKN